MIAPGFRVRGLASREERNARNESLFREVNERIKGATFSVPAETLSLLCECGDVDCTQEVELPVSTYEDVRGEGEWFLVVSGHENPTIERVIKRVGNVVVVEKAGEGGDAARELDPRSE
jgi:hypothetical protein